MLMRYFYTAIVLISIITLAGTVRSQIPRQIAYQGILTNADGTLLPDGNHTLTVALYTASSGGSSIYTETQTVVVIKGLFNMMIGATTPLPPTLAFDRAYFLGVAADGSSELAPRTPMLAAPYAFNSAHALVADTLALPFAAAATSGSSPVFEIINSGSSGSSVVGIGGGGSGIGTMTGSAVWGSGGAGYFGVTGYSDGGSSSYAGVLARGSTTTTGLMAESENGTAVDASSGGGEAITATTAGVGANAIHGVALDSTEGSIGVVGESNSKANGSGPHGGPTGVLGLITRAAPGGYSAGVRGINNGTGGLGIGVIGYQDGSGWGVYGETPKGFGVYGYTSDTLAASAGVRGETNSRNGFGVHARYSGTGVGTALLLDNGAIKMSGTTRAAFIHTATPANKVTANGTDIDNPICNGDPNCIVFVTQKLNPSNITYNNSPIGIYYSPITSKWEIFNESNGAIPDNAQFEVLVIKQ